MSPAIARGAVILEPLLGVFVVGVVAVVWAMIYTHRRVKRIRDEERKNEE